MNTQVFRPRRWLGAFDAASSIPIVCSAFAPDLWEPLLQHDRRFFWFAPFLAGGFGLLMLLKGIACLRHRVTLSPTGVTYYGGFGSQVEFTVNWDDVQSWTYRENLPIDSEPSEGGPRRLVWVADPNIYFTLTDGRVITVSRSVVNSACFRQICELLRLALADRVKRA